MYEEQLAEHRRSVQLKFEKERRSFEEEKRKKQLDIQSAIDRLQIGAGQKDSLKRELDSLALEQRTMQTRIEELEREFEQERAKKRQVEREIGEIKISASGTGTESSRVQWLREEILKKNAQISAANKEYK